MSMVHKILTLQWLGKDMALTLMACPGILCKELVQPAEEPAACAACCLANGGQM